MAQTASIVKPTNTMSSLKTFPSRPHVKRVYQPTFCRDKLSTLTLTMSDNEAIESTQILQFVWICCLCTELVMSE